jgi:hypothetical protein
MVCRRDYTIHLTIVSNGVSSKKERGRGPVRHEPELLGFTGGRGGLHMSKRRACVDKSSLKASLQVVPVI